MWLEQRDYVLPGLGENIEVNRFYNSIIQTSGLFGLGWSTTYDESLVIYPDDRMIRLNEPDGRASYFGRANTANPFTSFSQDVVGQIVKATENTAFIYTLTYKDGRVHKFDASGRLLWQKDRNGNQTTLNYDGNGLLTGITDAVGRTLSITLNANGNVFKIWDALTTEAIPVATYEYYPSPNQNRLQTVTFKDGSKYKFEYVNKTINGQPKVYLETVKDVLDNVLETHSYDDVTGKATTSEKHGGVEKYTFDYSIPGQTTVTDALTPARVTKYFYTRKYGTNLITKTEGVCSCGGSGSEVTEYFYDDTNYSWLNLVKIIDALGRQTLYTYDSDRNVTQVEEKLGTTSLGIQKWTYNLQGQVLTYKDRVDSSGTNNTSVNTYDTNGNLLTAKDALNNTTILTYTTLGQLATIKDALNNITTLTYDTQGRMTQIKDANNKNTNFGYDARARVTSTTNAKSETTSFEYDLNNRLKKVIYPDTNFVLNTYDLAGRRTAVTDERNNTTSFGYDNAYRLTSITDSLSHTTNFGYNLMSNLTSQTDALGNVTNLEYNDFNRLKKVIYPPATTGATQLEESMTYDTMGNVKTRVDTAGRTTSYDYDNLNRLIKITDPLTNLTQFEYNLRSQMTKVKDASSPSQEYVFTYDPLGRQLSQTRAGSTMTFEYDAVGNRTKRIDYTGRQTTYEYDVLNRLKKINYLAGSSPGTTATYTYDELSRLATAVNQNGSVVFTYDNRNRLKTETDVFGHIVEYGYDAASNRTQLKLDTTVHTTYAYDAANRLTTLTDDASQNFTYGYDIANKLISKALPNGITTTHEYDGMSRLKRLKHQSSSATLTDNNFSYSPANQISQIAEITQTRNFSYDNIDRLTDMNGGTESYTYNAVGNRTASHRSATYAYQPFNKLTSTATATYSYDANGNMTTKSEGKDFWRYGWDHENRLAQAANRKHTVRYKYDALGRRVERNLGSGKERTKFTYDGLDVVIDDNAGILTKYQNGPGIDNKLKLTSGGVSKYFLQDHLGSTVGLADASSSVVSSASYDSFGNSTNNLTTRYQYTGREFDSFTGLQFSRARWYDPNLGRFVSEDPIGLAGGDVNLFGYVKNNPVGFRDPTGLFRCNPIIGALLGGLAGLNVGGAAGVFSGAVGGGALGGVLGGSLGTLVAPGVGTLGGGGAGAAAGATAGGIGLGVVGGVAGAGIGAYVGYNYCNQPEAPTSCQTTPRTQPQPSPMPVPQPLPAPTPGTQKNDPEDCYAQYEADSEICRTLPTKAARARCWKTAADRQGDCIAGRPPRPLITW